MGHWTIKAINSGPREWSSKQGGQMLSYRVDLVSNDDGRLEGDVELTQKKTAPLPQVGQVLEGDIEQNGNFGLKFKKVQGGGARGGGGRPRDPQERASIERQVAFKGAVDLVVAMNPEGMGETGIESTLSRLFEFSVGLIQGGAGRQAAPANLGRSNPPPADAAPRAATVDNRTAALEDMRKEYPAWRKVVGENHGSVWANKLTTMGIANVDAATEEQIVNLTEWMRVATQPPQGAVPPPDSPDQ